jgi:hypothetical protein
LVCLSILLFPNSCTVLFWEFCFLPFSVHVQTNIIYLTLLSLNCSNYKIKSIKVLINVCKLYMFLSCSTIIRE